MTTQQKHESRNNHGTHSGIHLRWRETGRRCKQMGRDADCALTNALTNSCQSDEIRMHLETTCISICSGTPWALSRQSEMNCNAKTTATMASARKVELPSRHP
jgi:hypothetical protein